MIPTTWGVSGGRLAVAVGAEPCVFESTTTVPVTRISAARTQRKAFLVARSTSQAPAVGAAAPVLPGA